MQDVAGDAVFFLLILENKSKAWVSDLYIPTVCFFVSGCATSLLAIVVNLELLARKLVAMVAKRSGESEQKRRVSLGDTHLSPELVSRDSISVTTLKTKFDAHKMDRRRRYCALANAIFKDIPMGTSAFIPTLSTYLVSRGTSMI